MDIFDEEIFNQMNQVPVQESKCVTQNDVVVIVMWIYVIELFFRFLRKQNVVTFQNACYCIEKFIVRNLENGSQDNLEEHLN